MSFDSTVLKLYAEEVAYSSALEEYCNEHPLDGYLYLQEQENTGIMDAKLEAELNSQGIFDSEIKDFKEGELEALENADKIYVSTQYIKYTYTGEKNDLEEYSISNSSTPNQKSQDKTNKKKWESKNFDVIENQDIMNEIFDTDLLDEATTEDYEVEIMSDEDIDALIKECYIDEESENKDSIFDKILTGIGIRPQNAYAAKSDNNIQESSYMKKSLLVIQYSDRVFVSFNCIWIKAPSNRLVDLVSMQWIGGSRSKNDRNGNFLAELSYDVIDESSGTSSKRKMTKDYTDALIRNWKLNTAAVAFQLPPEIELYMKNGLLCRLIYTNIRMHVSFDLYQEGRTIDMWAEYQHQKKKMDINSNAILNTAALVVSCIMTPGVVTRAVIGVAAISTGLQSVSTKTYYETCGGEPCNVSFTYK